MGEFQSSMMAIESRGNGTSFLFWLSLAILACAVTVKSQTSSSTSNSDASKQENKTEPAVKEDALAEQNVSVIPEADYIKC